MITESDAQAHILGRFMRFELVDPERNRYRFYLLGLQLTLWGEIGPIQGWGRLGGTGHQMVTFFDDRRQAETAFQEGMERRLRRGYQMKAVG